MTPHFTPTRTNTFNTAYKVLLRPALISTPTCCSVSARAPEAFLLPLELTRHHPPQGLCIFYFCSLEYARLRYPQNMPAPSPPQNMSFNNIVCKYLVFASTCYNYFSSKITCFFRVIVKLLAL